MPPWRQSQGMQKTLMSWFGVRRLVGALFDGPRRQVAANQSGDESPHSKPGPLPELFQRFVFRARGDQGGEGGISILPKRKEILVGLARGPVVTTQDRRPRKAQLRQKIKRREGVSTTMIKNHLEFNRGLGAVPVFEITLTAQILGPEIAEDLVLAG